MNVNAQLEHIKNSNQDFVDTVSAKMAQGFLELDQAEKPTSYESGKFHLQVCRGIFQECFEEIDNLIVE